MILRLLFILRRRWPIALVLPLVGVVLGLLLSPSGDARRQIAYQATANVAVDQQTTDQSTVRQTLVESRQGEVARKAAAALGVGTTVADVSRAVSWTFDEKSFVITLRARADRPSVAQEYLEAYSNAFVVVNNAGVRDAATAKLLQAANEARVAREAVDGFIAAHRAELDGPAPPRSIQVQLEDLRTRMYAAEDTFNRLNAEVAPADQYRIIAVDRAALIADNRLELPASRPLRMALGLLLGALGAVAVIALVEKLNPRVDSPEQAAQLIGAPVLAMVPVIPRRKSGVIERATMEEFQGPFAEAFRSMRTHLNFRMQAEGRDEPPRIMVTSAMPSEGKSTAAAFLAVAYAEAQRPPLVVGADLRRPSIHEIFGVERIPGLSSLSPARGATVPLARIVKTDPVTRVLVVPSGPSVERISDLLDYLRAITTTARDAGRLVVVDTPPTVVANDAADFLAATDWVIVVVRVGRSTERSVKQMMAMLRMNEANVVGVVMVGSVESTDAKRYYHAYYSIEPEEDDADAATSGSTADDGLGAVEALFRSDD